MGDNPCQAIESTIAQTLDVLPTHWVLVVATADGEIHSMTSPDMPLWQRKGLLEWDASSYGAQPLWTLDEDDDR